MKRTRFTFIGWLGAALLGVTVVATAVSPLQVQQQLQAGKKITFVDVRGKSLFKQGHIPGAINIPAQVVPEKQLPPLGRVVVYDDGLGNTVAASAASALNRKSGITAEVLDGGYAAWKTVKARTTQAGGMKPEVNRMITYAQLKKAQSANVVLVDLRQAAPAAVAKVSAKNLAAAGNSNSKSQAPLVDLQSEFPQARVVKSPFGSSLPQPKIAAVSSTPPLLVLVDNGDGRAQAMARTLKANGIKRFVILAGGEQILAVHGQAGLQRIGTSVNMRTISDTRPAMSP